MDTFWPDAQYNTDVPRIRDVLGHDFGERISSPEDLVTYLQALALAMPARTRLVEYARSWEDRPLIYIVISSKTNMDNLDNTLADMARLASPDDLDKSTIDKLIDKIPPSSWLAYGVHGDEISPGDAALLTAYHLLAAENDETVQTILDNTIAVIDPAQNPDGRARFTHHYRQTFGIEPAPSAISAERVQPWPGGRSNHYLFDMNRDWFAQTQPEVQGRIANLRKFHPVVYADIHEMGSDQSYFFPPAAEPLNRFYTSSQQENLELYGKGNAALFDQFNFDYFTREIFDLYFPGYGDTWPAFQGATGMTYEMASARGLEALRRDGVTLTYKDGIHRHFVASIATLKTTATHSQKLLQDYYEYRRSGMDSKKHYILSGKDTSLVAKAAAKLLSQGIVVKQSTKEIKTENATHAPGCFVVPAKQPAGRLVQTLLDKETPLTDEFWQEQERRRSKDLNLEIYDILAWSLPDLYNIKVEVSDDNLKDLAPAELSAVQVRVPDGKFAYLVAWGSQASALFLTKTLRRGVVVHGADKTFTMQGREYPAGTLIIKSNDNDGDLAAKLTELGTETQIEIVGTESSWVDDGISFGSIHVKRLNPPNIALAWDSPTRASAAGNTRFVLERQFGYPLSPVRTRDLARPELFQFDVLILPDGGDYAAALGKSGMSNLKTWLHRGGTLITIHRATRLLFHADLKFLDTALEARGEVDKDTTEKKPGLESASIIEDREQYADAISPKETKPDVIPGVLLRGQVDPDHWLTSGLESFLNFMVTGEDVYAPLKRGQGTNVVKFVDHDDLVVAGYLWKENRKQWAHKPAVMTRRVGQGLVIGFTTDPNFRAYLDGLNVLFINAVFRGPAHTKGL